MNYETLLNIPYKTYKIFLIIVLLIICLFIVICNVEVYDVYNTYGYYDNGSLVVNIPITYSDTLLNGEYFKIDEKTYEIDILTLSDVLVDTNSVINYQVARLALTNDYPQNLVINISIYYNKEKVIKKIKNLL